MALATEGNHRGVVNQAGAHSTPGNSMLAFRAVCALVLMTAAANCFLKYLWWTAYYSTLNGIPKVSTQAQTANSRAMFYGWSFLVLEIAALLLICTLVRFRQTHFLRTAARVLASLTVTVIGTGLLALVLSWIKQS